MNNSERQPSTWAPLRIATFRALWLAALVSNIGTWMQTVGAQWLLVDRPHASTLVALVQTANALPYLLFGLIGGVLADTLDRRRLLIAVQTALVAVGVGLAALTFAHHMSPALLLLFTFTLGSGAVLATPAAQALLPDLVPRSQLPSASALNAISINLARAIGPAVAGVLIAAAGVGAVFAVNAATSLAYGLVILFWRPAPGTLDRPEPFVAALRAGGRYVRHAPVVKRVMLRSGLFLVPASSLWALLPVIAADRLALSSQGYGLLLAALGLGAIAGAVVLPVVRARLSSNAMMTLAGCMYTIAIAAMAVLRNVGPVLVLLVFAGTAWVIVLSNVNAALQVFLPAWVRGRSLSIYQMVLFGSQAVGALLWGLVAGAVGLLHAMLIAAAAAAVSTATIRLWPFIDTAAMDRAPAVSWPDAQFDTGVDPSGREVLVSVTYRIPQQREPAFLEAMTHLRLSRMRTGAIRWGLYRHGEVGNSFTEFFTVASWEEHQRQHNERLTGADVEIQNRASAFSDLPPTVTHMISADQQHSIVGNEPGGNPPL